jgi:hypothetical protein
LRPDHRVPAESGERRRHASGTRGNALNQFAPAERTINIEVYQAVDRILIFFVHEINLPQCFATGFALKPVQRSGRTHRSDDKLDENGGPGY